MFTVIYTSKICAYFFIPLFPIGKIGILICSNCNNEIKKKHFDTSTLTEYTTLKLISKTPKWTFFGTPFLVALLIYLVLLIKNNNENILRYVNNPQKGDVYEIKIKHKEYTLYLIENIKGDTIYFLKSLYETNKMSGLNDIKEKGKQAYSSEIFYILKPNLVEMREKNIIIDIHRD